MGGSQMRPPLGGGGKVFTITKKITSICMTPVEKGPDPVSAHNCKQILIRARYYGVHLAVVNLVSGLKQEFSGLLDLLLFRTSTGIE